MNFFGLLDVRVNPYALSPKGLLGEPPYITYGDSVMQEFTKTNLIQLTLFSLSFVMMSGLGSQASIMLLTTWRIKIGARDGAFLFLLS